MIKVTKPPTGHVTPVMSNISNQLSMEIKCGKITWKWGLGPVSFGFQPSYIHISNTNIYHILVKKYVNNLS